MENTINNTDSTQNRNNKDFKLVIFAILGLLLICILSTLCIVSFNFFQGKRYERKVESLRERELREMRGE